MDPLKELVDLLEEKYRMMRQMIDSYEEGMDYAAHCTLQGFAEGLAYALEEIRNKMA
jgi:hypothetical protein